MLVVWREDDSGVTRPGQFGSGARERLEEAWLGGVHLLPLIKPLPLPLVKEDHFLHRLDFLLVRLDHFLHSIKKDTTGVPQIEEKQQTLESCSHSEIPWPVSLETRLMGKSIQN